MKTIFTYIIGNTEMVDPVIRQGNLVHKILTALSYFEAVPILVGILFRRLADPKLPFKIQVQLEEIIFSVFPRIIK